MYFYGDVMTREILALPGATLSPLHRRTYKVIQDADKELTKLIHTWRFLNAGPPMRVKKYDGSDICYQGVAFSGSPVLVFWNDFIDPYLENYSIKILQQTSALAMECQFSVEECVEEAKNLLHVMIRRVYGEMAETDRILRGDGINFPQKRDVSGYIESMSRLVSEHAQIEKMKKPSSTQTIYNIESITSNNLQLGNNNNIESGLRNFFENIIHSGDNEAITAALNLLKIELVKKLLPPETLVSLSSITDQRK